MLAGIRIYTSDSVWRQIFSDLNATVLDSAFASDADFDKIAPDNIVSPLELKSLTPAIAEPAIEPIPIAKAPPTKEAPASAIVPEN